MRIAVRSLLAATLLSACAPGESAVATPTPSHVVIIQAATAPPGFKPFASTSAPYRACYPETWQVRTDWVDIAGITGDAFVGGSPGDLPSVVSVFAERAPGYDTAQYLDVALTNLRAVGLGTELLGVVRLGNVDVQRLRFARLTATGQRYTVQEAIWAQTDYGWILSVSTPPAEAERAAALMALILGCFRTP
jgi:hypothetical protein